MGICLSIPSEIFVTFFISSLILYRENVSLRRRLPSDRWAWSDETGTYNCPKEGYRLPSSQWQWIGDWEVVYVQDETDDDGWQYAVDFPRLVCLCFQSATIAYIYLIDLFIVEI